MEIILVGIIIIIHHWFYFAIEESDYFISFHNPEASFLNLKGNQLNLVYLEGDYLYIAFNLFWDIIYVEYW